MIRLPLCSTVIYGSKYKEVGRWNEGFHLAYHIPAVEKLLASLAASPPD
jgi:hypothetical protein